MNPQDLIRPGVGLETAVRLLHELLGEVRLSREAMKAYSVHRLRDTHARLDEVTSTTESAATEMLNGLDRALATVDEAQRTGGPAAAAVFDRLRAEVNELYGHLQFQDIISQQLAGVGALLAEIEARMETVADILDRSATPAPAMPAAPAGALTYNPDASARDAAGRQATIDEAFSAAHRPAPAERLAR